MIYQDYSILGQAQGTTRQFALDPRAPLDWAGPVPLQPAVYQTVQGYDALRRPLSEQTPDGSVIGWRYALSGRLAGVTLRQGTSTDVFVTDIAYNANDQRERLYFGNQAIQTLSYEATTERLLTLTPSVPPPDPTARRAIPRCSRPATPTIPWATWRAHARPHGGTGSRRRPARGPGRLPLRRAVPPEPGHRPAAPGHQGRHAPERLHAEPVRRALPRPRPGVTLEPYAERYDYDDSGNLVRTRHDAASASFQRDNPVQADSNRLAGVPCDGNGNTLNTALLAPTALRWDERNNLIGAGPVARPDGASEQVWMSYDFTNTLAQRVMERWPRRTAPPSCARRS